ncbi:MAG: CHAT domain-containing protein [candidate division Zixibacteria bacterium]|nr:CHAT domain-containing protein [candidate division Zixibacteria bacterium]
MAVEAKKMKEAVEAFLSSGSLNGCTTEALAAACDQKIRALTQVSSTESVALGRQFVQRSQRHGGLLYRTALRTLGWALLVAGDYPEAKKAYLKARSLLRGDALLRARIDRVLIDVYMYLGNLHEAKRRAKIALAAFEELKAKEEIAKTKHNYANLLHRQDRHNEARQLYREAGEFFDGRGNKLAAALCFYNQANTEVQLFDFPGATSLYSRARRIFEEHGQQLHAYGCLYGLAWLHMLEGNFHLALQELNECEVEYRRGKHARELVLCQLDRAEVYLGLNLFIDARNAALEALNGARRLGITYESAKARFYYGKALMGMGRVRAARTALTRAENGFREDRNWGFLAAVKLTLAHSEQVDQQKLSIIRAARELFYKAQLPLWEAVCDLKVITSWPEERGALRRLARNPAVKSVPHLLAQRYTVLGDREASHHRMELAVDYWSRAADILDGVRAKLPPVELRSSFFTQHSDPHRKLIKAEYDQKPLDAAVWSERFKTAGLWSTSEDFFLANPVRKKVEASLAELAQQVTAVSEMIADSGGTRGLRAKQPAGTFDRLRQKVRHDLLRLEKLDSPETDSHAALKKHFREASRKQTIIQYHVAQADIIAVVHHRGESHSYLYPDGVNILKEYVARWRFFVEFSQSFRKKPRKSDLADEQELLGQIGNWLLAPLELPSDARHLLVLPEGQISSLPWQAIRLGKNYLSDRSDVTFAPSLRHHLHAQSHEVKSRKIKIFVGQSSGLPHLREEVAAVSNSLRSRYTDIYDPCRRADWPDNSQARIWHFSGHARLRVDNPFYSSLLLDDGPLFAADFRIKRNQVGLVTLAACRTGQQTSLPGEEASGLVRSLLEMGARNVVASHWAVADASTSTWMDLFYTYYLAGSSVGRAIQRTVGGVRERFPSAYHWGAFSVFGAG